jgi:hypothetical protein
VLHDLDVVTAPGSEGAHDLVSAHLIGPEVAEQGIEVACGFDPLLVRDGFQVRTRIEGAWCAL